MEPKNLVSKSKLLFFDFFLLSFKDTITAKFWGIESTSALLKKLSFFILRIITDRQSTPAVVLFMIAVVQEQFMETMRIILSHFVL
jgi:hypothetical protein